MPSDELPVEVLTELGRVTWAAIKLEDYVEGVCSVIDPRNPREDKRQISAKIKDAQKVLAGWPAFAVRDEANAWLERARLAIDRRNAALHATPMIWLKPGGPRELFLGEMPRKDRPYTERALTVESLNELRSVLVGVVDGWREVTIAAGEYRRRQLTGDP